MVYKNGLAVAIKRYGKVLREEGENIYLPFGSEYTILLKNKEYRKALVEIEVDGENVLGGSKFILGSNETQEIKGFMRDMTKTNAFRFIKKTKEISNHRGNKIDDGLVRVSYQFELPTASFIPPTPIYRSNFNRGNYYGVNDHYAGEDFVTYCSNLNTPLKATSRVCDNGITVKGSEINQSYTYGTIGALCSNIDVIIFNLKGLREDAFVTKPLTTKTKVTCNTCGRGNKSFNKFCYNCGSYLR